MAAPTMTRRGRPPGRTNPISSQQTALEYLLRNRQSAEVTLLAYLGAAGVVARRILKANAEVITWFVDARAKLRRVPAPPAFLTDFLRNFDHAVGVESFLKDIRGAEGLAALPAMVIGIEQGRSTLEVTKALAKTLNGAQRLGFEKWTEEAAFALLPYVHSTSMGSSPVTPSELMALAVVVGLEDPNVDHDRRLNTWGKRFRHLRRKVAPPAWKTLGLVAHWLRQIIGARTQGLGRHVVGLLTNGREVVNTLLSAHRHEAFSADDPPKNE